MWSRLPIFENMEIVENNRDKILRLLDLIERMNVAIKTHEVIEGLSGWAMVKQYQIVKDDLTKQLQEVLAEFDVKFIKSNAA
jgi:hypothetical protein